MSTAERYTYRRVQLKLTAVDGRYAVYPRGTRRLVGYLHSGPATWPGARGASRRAWWWSLPTGPRDRTDYPDRATCLLAFLDHLNQEATPDAARP